MDAARLRYAQAEELAAAHGEHRLLMAMLNNYAYTEYTAGAHERAQEVAERLQAMAAEHDFELDPAELDTIGCIQIANGQFAEAEQTMLDCIAPHARAATRTPTRWPSTC